MAQSTRPRNLEVATALLDPESFFRSAREEPAPSVQVPMPEDDEHSSVATQGEKAGNRLKH